MRDKVKLVSTADTGHYYVTTKNKNPTSKRRSVARARAGQQQSKIEIRKFDPVVRKHVIYKEAKLK